MGECWYGGVTITLEPEAWVQVIFSRFGSAVSAGIGALLLLAQRPLGSIVIPSPRKWCQPDFDLLMVA